MSFQITTAFVDQFKNAVTILIQDKGSKIRPLVKNETGVGKQWFTEQIGATTVVAVSSRHGDSPLINTPHARRSLSLDDFEWGDLIDDLDKVRMLIDPASPYVQNAAMAFGRKIDEVIVAAMTGDALTGVDGATTTVFPAGQTIAVNFVETGGAVDSNLTVAKLREAKQKLDTSEVPDDNRHCVLSADNLRSLLTDSEITSSDFNSVKALVRGEVDTYLGFSFTRSQRLAIDGNNVRSVLCFHGDALSLGMGQDVKTNVAPRPDKRFSMYAYMSMALGATRLQEEMVVEVLSDEDL